MKRLLTLPLLFLLSGCQELAEFNDFVDSIKSKEFTAQSLLSANPSSDFRNSGHVVLSVGERIGPDARVETRDSFGQWSECRRRGHTPRGGAPVNAFAVLVDGSGSMELEYFNGECDTCPHDPGRERVGAARRFVWKVQEVAPRSDLFLGEFGPTPHPEMLATRILSDFTDSSEHAEASVDQLMGYEPVGTPLWDSLGEMVEETAIARQNLNRATGEEVGSAIVILSDGQDNQSNFFDLDSVSRDAIAAGVPIFAIGLGPASASAWDPEAYGDQQTNTVLDLQRVAQRTGGFYSSVDEPGRLYDLFDAVADGLAEGYSEEIYECWEGGSAPASGSLVEGRIVSGNSELPWFFLAP